MSLKIVSLADVAKLTPAATLKQLVDVLATEQRAFICVAKLAHRLEETLAQGETLGAVLRAKGIRKGTVDNARYAMRVIDELVIPGHVTEKIFDGFSFRDCFRIARSMSPGSKLRLEPADVALVIKKMPKSWDDELESLIEHGLTVAEKEAADKAAATPAPTDPETDDETTPEATEPTTPAAAANASTSSDEPPAPVAETPEPTPENVIAMPQASTADTATALADKLEAVLVELPAEDLAGMRDRLMQLAATITAVYAEPAEAKAPAKRRGGKPGKVELAA